MDSRLTIKQNQMKLGAASTVLTLMLSVGCRRDAAQEYSGDPAICEVHDRMLTSRVGYLPSSGILIDPVPDSFTVRDASVYPHAIDQSFTDEESEFATRRVTIHYCDECQRRWEQAEAEFLKLSRPERIRHQEAEMLRILKEIEQAVEGVH